MSESKIIGCCTARTWALTAAFLNLVFSSVVVITIIVGLLNLPELERKLINGKPFEIVRTALSLVIAVAVVDFMAFLLIFGVQRRSSSAVLAWLCYACVVTIVNAGLFLSRDNPIPRILGFVLGLIVKVILLSAVYIYWKEIRGSSRQTVVTNKRDNV